MPIEYKYVKGQERIHSTHKMVESWVFYKGEEEEAELCGAMAAVCEKNGLSVNDLSHLFPAVLRMLKTESKWAS